MSDLKHIDRMLLEQLLGMGGGYVLDFSDVTYATFFKDYGIDIDDIIYCRYGTFKAKRMRGFWEINSDAAVGKILDGLFKYIEAMMPRGAGGPVEERHWAIVRRLLGTASTPSKVASTEREFLDLEFQGLELSRLSLAPAIEAAIRQRTNEIKQCLINNIPLAVIFHSGSALEGLLLDIATKKPQLFNTASAAPKANGKVAQFHNWSLNDFINVAYECGVIGLDVKKFSHALRDFRNYIHPFQQASSGFAPDTYTAKISWQVLQAAIADLTGARKR